MVSTCATLLVLLVVSSPQDDRLAHRLRALDPHVLPGKERDAARRAVREDQRRRVFEANRRSSRQWRAIESRGDWERFRDERLARLRESLGSPGLTASDTAPRARVTGEVTGDGFRIENTVLESRPGGWITANVYAPSPPRASMPGIVISHSHHRPKEQSELQDMGMTWARAGCVVVVPDHLGHGERRQHPFHEASDFERPFRVSRQDYYFRYDLAAQLDLAGESLMGWLAADLMRCVDLLVARPGVDADRIVLLGAVAGGGDPAAVAGALDRRIDAVVPFNFGGPQPETTYPLPDDAERSFNYAGSGSWESTRNLRGSAAGGFLPWVIVGGIAPRRLVHAHEFAWDRERDPVWKRYRRIYQLLDAPENLAFAHGRGALRGRPPESSHCTNIGRVHREMIHPALARWFGIEVTREREYSRPRDRSELRCMTDEAARELRPKSICEALSSVARSRPAPPEALSRWERALGDVAPDAPPRVRIATIDRTALPGVLLERLALEVEPGIVVPALLLIPASASATTSPTRPGAPLVVALARLGKAWFLAHRAEALAALLEAGIAVCVPDVRGAGESAEGSGLGRSSAATSRSSTEQMLGGTMAGARLRDVRALLAHLRERRELDASRIALWGDSPSSPLAPRTDHRVPRRIGGRPEGPDPLGGLLALLGAALERDVRCVLVHGGLVSFRSVLDSPFVFIPHDVAVPGALGAGDLAGLVSAIAPRPARLGALVDGLGRAVDAERARAAYRSALEAYAGASGALHIAGEESGPAVRWLIERLR